MKFRVLLVLLQVMVSTSVFAKQFTEEDYQKLDSMKSSFRNIEGIDQLDMLTSIVGREEDPDSILKYSDILLKLASVDTSYTHMYDAYLQMGNANGYLGKYSDALEMYLLSVEMADKLNSEKLTGTAYIAMAGNYTDSENLVGAIQYYKRGIAPFRKSSVTRNDSLNLATGLFNLGDLYIKIEKYDSAELLINQSKEIFVKADKEEYEPYWLGSFGLIEASRGNQQLAEEYLNQSLLILEDYYDFSNVSTFLRHLSELYLNQGDISKALDYASRSLALAKEYDLKRQMSEVNLTLSKIYQERGQLNTAFEYYKTHIAYRDSINNLATITNMANQRTEYEVSRKQDEVDLLEKEFIINSLKAKRKDLLLYGALVLLVLLGLLVWGFFRRFKLEKETKEIIQIEKDRSDELLLNILPEKIADELKINGKVKAHRFNSATVLFTDFKSFSSLAEKISPEKLVESIDYYFKEFDAITQKYDLEKIKTIGDSYMCAGGLPTETKRHAFDVIKAGKEMMAFTYSPKPEGIVQFDMRIGIHTGPIVAGIVGVKKWQYDIWGDTVNVASRMETNSTEGRINISGTTYEIIKDEFDCEFRGSIDIKNRGIWKMYYLAE